MGRGLVASTTRCVMPWRATRSFAPVCRMILYYARIAQIALIESRKGPHAPDATLVTQYRAWPWMCDNNFHINNARYLTYMDYGRTAWVGRTGVFKYALQHRYAFVLGGATLTFRRPLDMMRPFSLHTRLAGFDARWFYFEQTFRDERGAFAARGLVRGSIRDGRNPVSVGDILASLGLPSEPPPMTDELSAWLAAADHTVAVIRGEEGRAGVPGAPGKKAS